MNQCFIDHITITAQSLEEGAALVEKTLGVTPQKGGEHLRMGTHNLLLRLGEFIFLEVIACNPKAEKPNRPRWFALDELKNNSPAILKTWVVRTENIESTLEGCSESIGAIEPMSRGDTHWLITIPEDGRLAVNECAPALVQWQTPSHPASKLEDYGLSLNKLIIYNSEPERIENLLKSINFTGDVEVVQSTESKLVAFINTPNGLRELHA